MSSARAAADSSVLPSDEDTPGGKSGALSVTVKVSSPSVNASGAGVRSKVVSF